MVSFLILGSKSHFVWKVLLRVNIIARKLQIVFKVCHDDYKLTKLIIKPSKTGFYNRINKTIYN